jgi:type IV pilus assembly protein PilY1
LGLGIKDTGAMGVGIALPAEAGATAGLPQNSDLTGLSFVADYDGGGVDWRDATTPGCMCEGFGVSANGISGYDSNENGADGLTVLNPGGTITGTDQFTTLVELSGLAGLTITHDYHPSLSPSLYEATVTITNNTGSDVTDLRYTRTMDWDVPPSEFSEFVTLQGAGLGDLIDSCDNGFQTGDPLEDCDPIFNEDANFADVGPADIGARFTFGFGDLAAGASKVFQIYYGAAVGETAALAALAAAGAQGIYSFGQSFGGATTGLPATFIFGFGGVGAPPVDPNVPEPASMLLLGGGLAGVLVRRYRRR